MECSRIAKTFNEILKFNPYHDSKGRFASAGAAASFTFRTKDPGKQYLADMAVARAKEKDAAASAGATDNKPQEDSPRMKEIHGIEDKIRKQNFESAAVVDDEGNMLYFKDGMASEVRFSRLECMQMQNNTLTHNHPRCSMFSPEDLNCMAANGLYEIRATNRDGTTYSMKQAAGGYSTQRAMDFVGKYASEYPNANKYAQKDLDSRGFADKVWKGEISAAQANVEFGRASAKYMVEWTSKNAADYGLEFTVEQRTVKKSYIAGNDVMKADTKSSDDYLVLDRKTNDLEDKAFKEWLDRAMKGPAAKTAKSFKDVFNERSAQ